MANKTNDGHMELLRKYRDLVETKKREKDKALGKRSALLSTLSKEFGIRNVNIAKRKLQELKEERQSLLAEFEEKMEALRDKYEL